MKDEHLLFDVLLKLYLDVLQRLVRICADLQVGSHRLHEAFWNLPLLEELRGQGGVIRDVVDFGLLDELILDSLSHQLRIEIIFGLEHSLINICFLKLLNSLVDYILIEEVLERPLRFFGAKQLWLGADRLR